MNRRTFLSVAAAAPVAAQSKPQLTSELIFPLEHWHNHASMVVELPGGDLLTCWFHGSGERTADDVVVLGARLEKGAKSWSKPFVMADTPGYPDTNATMFLDPRQRLWLMWPTILANEWHTALMKYKIATEYASDGSPRWEVSEVLHVTPGDEFAQAVAADAVLLTPPLDVRAKRDGYHLIFSLQELDVPSIYSSILTNLKTIKERPQLVQRFVAAMSETIYFVEKNPEKASQSLGKALAINDPEVLQSAYQAYARRLVNRRMTVPGKTVADAVELAREEVPQLRRKPEELYDNSFTDNLVKSGFLKDLWGSVP